MGRSICSIENADVIGLIIAAKMMPIWASGFATMVTLGAAARIWLGETKKKDGFCDSLSYYFTYLHVEKIAKYNFMNLTDTIGSKLVWTSPEGRQAADADDTARHVSRVKLAIFPTMLL